MKIKNVKKKKKSNQTKFYLDLTRKIDNDFFDYIFYRKLILNIGICKIPQVFRLNCIFHLSFKCFT
jgi:hypothetical protein